VVSIIVVWYCPSLILCAFVLVLTDTSTLFEINKNVYKSLLRYSDTSTLASLRRSSLGNVFSSFGKQCSDVSHVEAETNITSQSTDKIRTKWPRNQPRGISQSDNMADQKYAAARALECPLFPSASMSSNHDTAP